MRNLNHHISFVATFVLSLSLTFWFLGSLNQALHLAVWLLAILVDPPTPKKKILPVSSMATQRKPTKSWTKTCLTYLVESNKVVRRSESLNSLAIAPLNSYMGRITYKANGFTQLSTITLLMLCSYWSSSIYSYLWSSAYSDLVCLNSSYIILWNS